MDEKMNQRGCAAVPLYFETIDSYQFACPGCGTRLGERIDKQHPTLPGRGDPWVRSVTRLPLEGRCHSAAEAVVFRGVCPFCDCGLVAVAMAQWSIMQMDTSQPRVSQELSRGMHGAGFLSWLHAREIRGDQVILRDIFPPVPEENIDPTMEAIQLVLPLLPSPDDNPVFDKGLTAARASAP